MTREDNIFSVFYKNGKPLRTYTRVTVFLTRISMGWLIFYAGITKVLNPDWTAAGYLSGAKTFSSLYLWLASPEMIGITNFLNEWGLTLIGLSLIFGIFVRFSAPWGALLMILYYFPVLDFPYPNSHAFIVDDHIIYALLLLLLGALRAGRIWGIDQLCWKHEKCKKFA